MGELNTPQSGANYICTQPGFSSPDFIDSVQLIFSGLTNQWFVEVSPGLENVVSVGSLAKDHTRAAIWFFKDVPPYFGLFWGWLAAISQECTRQMTTRSLLQARGMCLVETEPCPVLNLLAKPHRNLGLLRKKISFSNPSSLKVLDNASIHWKPYVSNCQRLWDLPLKRHPSFFLLSPLPPSLSRIPKSIHYMWHQSFHASDHSRKGRGRNRTSSKKTPFFFFVVQNWGRCQKWNGLKESTQEN